MKRGLYIDRVYKGKEVPRKYKSTFFGQSKKWQDKSSRL